jgi:hypothetical protein
MSHALATASTSERVRSRKRPRSLIGMRCAPPCLNLWPMPSGGRPASRWNRRPGTRHRMTAGGDPGYRCPGESEAPARLAVFPSPRQRARRLSD